VPMPNVSTGKAMSSQIKVPSKAVLRPTLSLRTPLALERSSILISSQLTTAMKAILFPKRVTIRVTTEIHCNWICGCLTCPLPRLVLWCNISCRLSSLKLFAVRQDPTLTALLTRSKRLFLLQQTRDHLQAAALSCLIPWVVYLGPFILCHLMELTSPFLGWASLPWWNLLPPTSPSRFALPLCPPQPTPRLLLWLP